MKMDKRVDCLGKGSISVGRLRELLAGFQEWDQVTFERHYVKDDPRRDRLDVVDVFEFGDLREATHGARVAIRLDLIGREEG